MWLASSGGEDRADDGLVAVDLDQPEGARIVQGDADIPHLPTLIIWGDADIAFRPQERERLEATFPDHKTVIVKGAGTYVESDAPEEFITAFRAWTATNP